MYLEVLSGPAKPAGDLLMQKRIALEDLLAPVVLARQLAFCLDPENPEQTEAFREKIVEVAEENIRQVHNLELLAEMEAGQAGLEPVDAQTVCEEVKEETRRIFEYYEKRLRLEVAGRRRLAFGNRELLKVVLHNLCLNSVNYASERGEVFLKLREGRKMLHLEVRDFGPIIPAVLGAQINNGSLAGPVKIPLRPDVSGIGLYVNVRFLEYMGTKMKLVRHRDGMSFGFELPAVRQGRLF